MALRVLLCAAAVLIASSRGAASAASPASYVTTIVGPPEVLAGPECCLFDSPFLSLMNADGVVLGYSANSASKLLVRGADINAVLPAPLDTGLDADANAESYSHCGKWLNAAWLAPDGVVHGFFHEEWHCDYAHNLYTNKSVGVALSHDGGRTFVADPRQIIAGANFSATARASECGEGDHGVVEFGGFLYLFFIEWDAPESIHGGTSVGVARSSVSDAGAPGSWHKYHAGAWVSPGVGGDADVISNVPGTAVYTLAALPQFLVSTGVIFSASCEVAYTSVAGDPTHWEPAAAGPLFTAKWSSWARNNASSELFGYPGLAALHGTGGGVPSGGAFVYVTYLNPGQTFSERYLVRRPLQFYNGSGATAPGAAPPPALAALSAWRADGAALREWVTSGPVTPASFAAAGGVIVYANASRAGTPLALLATAAPPAPAPVLRELVDCALPAPCGAVALALLQECGKGALLGGAVLRTSGWVAATADDARALGWSTGGVRPLGSGAVVATDAVALWRCAGAGGASNFSAALGDTPERACVARGWPAEGAAFLGFAFAPL